MEEIYANVEYDRSVDSNPSTSKTAGHQIYSNVEDEESQVSFRPSTPHTGPSSSESRSHGAAVLSLGLLSVFLLAGLVGLGVHYHNSVRGSAADLSTIKANLTERLRATEANLTERLRATEVNLTERLRATEDNLTERLRATEDKLTSVSEERDLLKSSLTQLTEEMDRLQRLSKQKKTCPAGWKMFSCSCYRVSTRSDSWEKSREDCRDKGADLVIIDSLEEQKFLTSIIKQNTWIGLNDRDNEGTWKWIDGTPLTQAYWSIERDNGGVQPDNGGGDPQWGEEDCAELVGYRKAEGNWNDVRCDNSLHWICEKLA